VTEIVSSRESLFIMEVYRVKSGPKLRAKRQMGIPVIKF